MLDYVGQQLGNYRLLRLLGQGAFAAVYLGEHQYLERLAAIKVLHVRIEPARQEAFRREARTIAQLDHPHIIGVHEFGIEDQVPYLVMEHMPGGTLRSRHPRGNQLSPQQIITYVKQIASALDYAHQQRVIHRDIKPENILLNARGEVVLSDFGLAVIEHTLESLSTQNPAGTPIYMAPEQIERKPCAASDQYALGVMVYEWLCGEPPFRGSLFGVFAQHLHKAPPSLCARLPELPPAVEDAVMGALAKDPQQRFVSVADFAQTLEEALFATQSLVLSGSPVHEPQDQTTQTVAHVPLVSVPSPDQPEPSDEATQPHLLTALRPDREPELMPNVSPTTRSQTTLKPIRHALPQTDRRVQEQNRTRMRERLRRTYEELLAQSLQGVARMELGLSDEPDAVQNAATLLFQTSTHASQLLPAGTSILQVYDEATRELLILGAPGAGKSTLLVDLARQLVMRAQSDDTHPLPVILPLSSWAVKRPPLQHWFAEQVAQIYNIPRNIAQRWIDEDQLLPLLDGLDEMEEAARPACIAAINAYHRDHMLLPLVVCSRQDEYEGAALSQRLILQNAVVVQPLTPEHVQSYLAQGGKPLADLRHVLSTNTALASIVTTPLMIHVLILTYQGKKVQSLSKEYKQLQQQIWTDYLAWMVERKGNALRYPLGQTRSWLSWLASQMRAHNQTVFYLEHLQPDWLGAKPRRVYEWFGVRLPAMIIGALVNFFIIQFFPLVPWGRIQALIFGAFLGGLLCSKGFDDTTRLASKRYGRWGAALFSSLMVGLAVGWSYGWGDTMPLDYWLFAGGSYGVMFGLGSLLLQFFLPASSQRSESALRWGRWGLLVSIFEQFHLRRALLVVLLAGLSSGLSNGLLAGSNHVPVDGPGESGLSYGFGYGLTFGLSEGLSYGLASVLIGVILEHLQDGIHLTERVAWTWRNLSNRLFASTHLRLTLILSGYIMAFFGLSNGLRFGLIYGLSDGPIGGLSEGLRGGLSSSLSIGLSFGLLYWLFLGLYQSIAQERIADRDRRRPNQGTRRSLRNSLLLGFLIGAIIAGMGIVTFGLIFGLEMGALAVLSNQPGNVLSDGLSYALLNIEWNYGLLGIGLGFLWFLFIPSCILFWMITGGLAVWRHYLIRLLLRGAQTFPGSASRFLDDATARILLQRLGGGYRFTHRLLLDYLADAEEHGTELPSPSL